MDRYQRVEKPRPAESINDNEIRITAQGLIRNYITYASTLLQEKQVGEIVLKAMGQAISKTVAIAEIIKKRIPGLYQKTLISSTSIIDVWEPIEEGLVPLEMTRQVSLISIILSTKELDINSPGYQAPSSVEQPKQENQYQQQQHWQQKPLRQARAPLTWVNQAPYGRGQYRGRGRGRGQSRGGYGNYQENGGNWNWGRGGGRGRGWGYHGAGYERGRSVGGRGYGRGWGWMGHQGRGRGNQE